MLILMIVYQNSFKSFHICGRLDFSKGIDTQYVKQTKKPELFHLELNREWIHYHLSF